MVMGMLWKSVAILITGIVIFSISLLLLDVTPIFPYESWFPTPVLSGFIAGFVVGALTSRLKNGIPLALLSAILGHLVYWVVRVFTFGYYSYTIAELIWNGSWWWNILFCAVLMSAPGAMTGVALAVLVATLLKEKREFSGISP